MTSAPSSKFPKPSPPTPFRWRVLALIPPAIYLVYLTVLFFAQHWIIFPRGHAQGNPNATPSDPNAEPVVFETPSGSIRTWYFPPSAERVTGIYAIVSHGNAELASNWFGPASELADAGIGALVVEYPGYGNAPGSPSQKSIAPVLDAAFDYLASLTDGSPPNGSKPARIVGLGSSIGAAALCDLTRRRDLAALALISPFRSLKAMAWDNYAPAFLVRSPFDNEEALSQFGGRTLIVHGKNDTIISFADGKYLASLDEDFTLLPIDSGHNDIRRHWDGEIAPAILKLFNAATE